VPPLSAPLAACDAGLDDERFRSSVDRRPCPTTRTAARRTFLPVAAAPRSGQAVGPPA